MSRISNLVIALPDPFSYLREYDPDDWKENCCNICAAERFLALDDERAIGLRNTGRFVALVSHHRPPSEFRDLYEERQRRIASGEHPGDLVCVCRRCGRDFMPWMRPEALCSACGQQSWIYDEGWSRTRAFKRQDMPRSDYAPALRLGQT